MPKDSQLNKKETDRLKQLIIKSGFPLQVEVSSLLYEHFTAIDEYTEISTSGYYLDKDEGKGRELDIKVSIPVPHQEKVEGPMIFLHLLIQCKNIPGNAWVFFKSPHRVISTCKSTSVLDALKWTPREHTSFTRLKGLHLESLLKTTVYHEFVLDKNASNRRDDNLFEAVISLAKATSYEFETSVAGFGKMVETTSEEELFDDFNYAEIFYPAVVFNGKMYLAEEVEKGREMSLTPIDHVGLLIDYISGSYKIELVINIVHKKAFERFEKMIIKDMEIWQNALNGDIGANFSQEVLKALKWYTSKGDVS